MRIANLTNRPVVLRLNSGRTLHLAPLAQSDELDAVETTEHVKLAKLRTRRVVEVLDRGKPVAKESDEEPAGVKPAEAPADAESAATRKRK